MKKESEETYDPGEGGERASSRPQSEPVDTEAPTVERADRESVGAWARALRSYVPTVKIAEGGFSEIWEALQVDLGRTVAIKRLKIRTDKAGKPIPVSARHVNMFTQEALVAAHLEHPNILPVYDLEYDAEGLPFLVMRRIRGEPWNEVLTRDFASLPPPAYLAKHLPVLLAVTRAVAYAHSVGILHRDLKPGQIMIGSFGEVLLMDWGLAMAYPRRVDDPDAPEWLRDPNALVNRPLNPAGTPSYMAPEQTYSTTHQLGPWTDVYLLGGILYRILTGAPPHKGNDASETFKLAQAGVVERVETVVPDRPIPRELIDIAHKALEPEPEKRFATVEEFLRALEDYMAGADKQRESVVLTIRARNQLGQQTIGYETYSEVINMLERALVLWPENREAETLRTTAIERYAKLALHSRDLKLARLLAERLAQSEARQALLDEIARAEELERQRDEELRAAQEHVLEERNRAERLLAFLVGDLYYEMRRIGRTDVLGQLCETALRYFQDVALETHDPHVAESRIRAYMNLSDVAAAQGNTQAAHAALSKALETIEVVRTQSPDVPLWCELHAGIYRRLGALEYHKGNYAEARRLYEAGYEALRSASAAGEAPEHDRERAMLHHGVALCYWRQHALEQALNFHMEADALLSRLCRMAPHNPQHFAERARVLATLGNVYRDLGDLESAVSVTAEALKLGEQLCRLDPGDLSRLSELVWMRNNLGLLQLIRGNFQQARACFIASAENARRLLQFDAHNLQHQRDLAFALSLAGELSYFQGKLNEARQLLGEALVIARELSERTPDSLYSRGGLARAHVQLGELLLALDERLEALSHLRRAMKQSSEILATAPTNPTAIKTWVRAVVLRALEKDLQENEVEELLAKAMNAVEQLTAPSDKLDKLDHQAGLALARGRFEEAAALMQQLANRHWLAPLLVKYARHLGVAVPELPAGGLAFDV